MISLFNYINWYFLSVARALQLADGPDEVHLAALGKTELKRYKLVHDKGMTC